jgi:alkylation response protein AidB-like acyl-CoA dehydrogenase
MLAQVAIEEVAGHATNGLGFIVAGRGPRDFLDIASPDQVERYVLPVLRDEAHESWAITEPHTAGSDVNAIQTTAVRDGDEWRLKGEKWYVTGGEKASFFLVLARRRRADVSRSRRATRDRARAAIHARPCPSTSS